MEVAAEVYGPEPKGLRTPRSELSDEELLERYRSLLGFDLNGSSSTTAGWYLRLVHTNPRDV
jgi:hypothetical protein